MPINASSGALSVVKLGSTNQYAEYWAAYNSQLTNITGSPYVDSDNYLYATCNNKLYRFNTGPIELGWLNNYTDTTSFPRGYPTGMAVDDTRNKIYVVGNASFSGTYDVGTQAVVFVGNTSDGTTRKFWKIPPYDTLASRPVRAANCIAPNPINGSFWIGGQDHYFGNSGTDMGCLMSFLATESSSMNYGKYFIVNNNSAATLYGDITNLRFSAAGNLYGFGIVYTTSIGSGSYIFKHNGTTTVWSRLLNIGMNDFCIDSSENLYVVGYNSTGYISKLNSSGTVLWTKTIANYILEGISTDGTYLYVGYRSTSVLSTGYFARFDMNGNFISQISLTSSSGNVSLSSFYLKDNAAYFTTGNLILKLPKAGAPTKSFVLNGITYTFNAPAAPTIGSSSIAGSTFTMTWNELIPKTVNNNTSTITHTTTNTTTTVTLS